MSFELARPWALVLLLAIPAYAWLVRARAPGALVLGRAWALEGRSASRVPGLGAELLRGVSWMCLVMAFAGPRTRASVVDETASGIGIVIALDISSSMLAEDFRPANRLAVAKQTVMRFIQGRRHDRIGLVAFAGEALTQVPVTLDYELLFDAISRLRPGLLEDGTAIGMGLATAASRLRATPGPSRVIVLLSDGENNRGDIDPRAAARAAAGHGIRVFTVGVGSNGIARVPIARTASGLVYGKLAVKIDEALLAEIASTTGGRYFRATDALALGRIFAQLDGLVRTSAPVRRYVEFREHHLPLILVGAALLVAEWWFRGTRWARVP